MSLLVLTANDLLEGDVVYLTKGEAWTRHLAQAYVFDDKEVAEDALTRASARSGEAVGVYLFEVTLKDGVPTPVHFREDFRRTGPSNKFHGKQAEQTEQSNVSL